MGILLAVMLLAAGASAQVTVAGGIGASSGPHRHVTADLDVILGRGDLFVRSWIDGPGPGARVAFGVPIGRGFVVAPGAVIAGGRVSPSAGLTWLAPVDGLLGYTNHAARHQVIGVEYLARHHVKLSADYHFLPSGVRFWSAAIGPYWRLKP